MSDDPETARRSRSFRATRGRCWCSTSTRCCSNSSGRSSRFLDGARHRAEAGDVPPARQHRSTAHGHAGRKRGVAALLERILRGPGRVADRRRGAAEAIAALAEDAEIVMLTAMPHRHRAIRRAHLDRLGFPYPLLTTETAKGPAIRQLRGEPARPVAFVDDIPHNLVSVRTAVADAHLFHLMATPSLRGLLPPLDGGHRGGRRLASRQPAGSARGSRDLQHMAHQRPAGLALDQRRKAGLLEDPRRADEQADRTRIPRLVHRAGFDQPRPVLARQSRARLRPGDASGPCRAPCCG